MTSEYWFEEPGQTAARLLVLGCQRRTVIHTIHTSGFVVLVPGSAVALPHSMLDPLLRMLVEAIGDVLPRHPGLYVVALHFLHDLHGILCDLE